MSRQGFPLFHSATRAIRYRLSKLRLEQLLSLGSVIVFPSPYALSQPRDFIEVLALLKSIFFVVGECLFPEPLAMLADLLAQDPQSPFTKTILLEADVGMGFGVCCGQEQGRPLSSSPGLGWPWYLSH